ncbi:MAG: hypothetical protein MR563_04500 [Spirochaetales bacterium]|nr:hypothetical protein [Spirochaetales bacterium]
MGRKAFGIIALILISLLTFMGCELNSSSSTAPGNLKIYLSSSAVSSLAADSSLTAYIRTGNSSGAIVKEVVLSKDSTAVNIDLNPGTYYLTLNNKSFTIATTISISSGGKHSVSINPVTTGKVKFVLSDSVKEIIKKNYYSLSIEIRKTVSSAPINTVLFHSGSLSNQLYQLENGSYYLTYTFSSYNGGIELTIPETVTVKSGETTQVDIDCKPNGTVKVEMSSEASSVSPSNFVIYFYCDAERTDLANSLKYYSLNNTLSLDPGTYYISYTCDNGDPFDIDETVDVVNGGASTVKVDKKNDINYVFIDDYIRNNSSNLYPPDRDGFRIVFSDKDSDYTYSYNYKYSNNVYLKKGTYNISFENNPDDSGFLVSSDTTQISIGAERSNLILNLWVVGSINFAINDSSEASVALTLEKIVESNESEVKKIYSVDNNVQKVYLPVGEYKVTGSLVTDNPYIDFRLPSETIFLYQKKNVDYRPEVFRTGVLELSLTDDFYEKLDKLSVVVHLYRNGEYFKDLVISETTRENNRWYLPEGVYTYELEYDKHLMNLAFDADSFNVSYAKTTPIVCNNYGFARCIAVDIQNKIPGASKIEYYSYQDYPVLKIRLRNYPEGSVIKLYDMSNGTRFLGEGDYFEISLDQQGINKDNLQIRITKDNMLLDVQQIGNLWK